MKKGVLLFLALLLPVLIYLFLKSFGKNEFDVPVLYADSVSAPASCTYRYTAPYQVPDSILRTYQWDSTALFTVIILEDTDLAAQHERSIQLMRVITEFKNEPLGIIRISGEGVNVNSGNGEKRVQRVIAYNGTLDSIRNCVFLLNSTQDAVVIDKDRRIRGQYRLTKREDADRMIMEELNILFKRY